MAKVEFNEKTGVVVPNTQTVRDDFAQSVQDALPRDSLGNPVNVDSTSPLGQVIDLAVAEVEAKNTEIAYLANQFNPATARGVFLDALANLYGLERKVSEPTVVVCTCTGLKGTVIPYGAIVSDGSGNQLRHSQAGGVEIPENGKVDTNFATIEHGEIEIAAGTVTRIVTVVPGWDTVTNAAAGVTGRTIEPDGELLNRMKESYAINANGTVENLQANLAALDGVLDCVVLENYTNVPKVEYGLNLEAHSVGICIVGGDDNAIARTIFERKSGGCGTNGETEVLFIDTEHFNASYRYRIVRPAAVPFTIQVTFDADDMNTSEKEAVIEALKQDFLGELKNPRVTLASTVYASRFYPCIQNVTETPIKTVLIAVGDAEPAVSIEIPANQSPALSNETIKLQFGDNL